MIKCGEITYILLVTNMILIYQKQLISKAPKQRDTDIIDMGDISWHFRYIDPCLIKTMMMATFLRQEYA